METSNQPGTEGRSPTFTVTLNKDGTRRTCRVVRQGAGDDGPVPINDEELEAVSGGARYNITFSDGCTISLQADTSEEAFAEAEAQHANEHGW